MASFEHLSDAALADEITTSAGRIAADEAHLVWLIGEFDRASGSRLPGSCSPAPVTPPAVRSEAAFAHLCGAAPIPASSGRTRRPGNPGHGPGQRLAADRGPPRRHPMTRGVQQPTATAGRCDPRTDNAQASATPPTPSESADPEATAETPEDQTPEVRRDDRYRTQLRAAEAERDALSGKPWCPTSVPRPNDSPGDKLVSGKALWLAGVDPLSLLDEEHHVDPTKMTAAVDRLLDAAPQFDQTAPSFDSGARNSGLAKRT